MGVVHTKESEYAKEMRKWESHPTEFGPGLRPYEYREFPKRLYKAGRNVAGKIVILDAQTVADEHEQRNLESRGFVAGGQGKAIEAWENTESSYAELAAERNFDVRRMSEKAQAEVKAVEATSGVHLPTIPETPIKKKLGRPAKVRTS